MELVSHRFPSAAFLLSNTMRETEKQTIRKTRAAALEAVARILFDHEDWTNEAVADVSRKIVRALGFK